MMGNELACGVRVQHPQDVVGAGCRAEEKQQLGALQIRDMRNPVQEDLVFSSDVTQLRIDALIQAASPTLSSRWSAGRVGSPLTTAVGSTLLAAAVFHIRGNESITHVESS